MEKQMEKSYLLRETTDLASKVGDNLILSSLQSGAALGHINHNMHYGVVMSIEEATGYLRQENEIVDNPNVGRTPRLWNLVGKVKTSRANKAAQVVLDNIPYDALQGIHDNAKAAVDGNLEGAIITYARAMEEGRQGEPITPEEEEELAPLKSAMNMAIGIKALEEINSQ